jgi:hypothetical protein
MLLNTFLNVLAREPSNPEVFPNLRLASLNMALARSKDGDDIGHVPGMNKYYDVKGFDAV